WFFVGGWGGGGVEGGESVWCMYGSGVEVRGVEDAASDAEPHQAKVLIVHFVLAALAQAS
ncbi:hypothetical protein UQ14_09550, partial [Escherichia coli]